MGSKLHPGVWSGTATLEYHHLPSTSDHSAHPPIRASLEDLKRPKNRELLRQHLTGTFPETAPPLLRHPSNELLHQKMSLKDRLSKKTLRLDSAHTDSDSDTLSPVSPLDSVDPRRLSAVPEADPGIDIEKAISLLQELKKTASPSDLVALHRALLPIKDTERVRSSLPLADISSPAVPTARRRVVLPPGLATRGGAEQDVLRRPNGARDEPPKAKPAIPDRSMHRPSGSQSSLAALDLVDGGAKSGSPKPEASSEVAYPHTGAFGPGTLRITNGAASPDLSLQHAPIVRAAETGERPSAAPTLQTRAAFNVLSAQTTTDSRPVRERIALLRQSYLRRTDELEHDQIVRGVDSPGPSYTSPHHLVSPTATGSIGEPLSPQSVVRFQPRRSQSISSTIAVVGVAESPSGKKVAMLEFASRLNTNEDSDRIEGETKERDATLAQLNSGNGYENTPILSSRNSDEQHSSPTKTRLNTPHKFDSGYSTDISFRSSTSRVSQDSVHPSSPVTTSALDRVAEQDEMHTFTEPLSLTMSTDTIKTAVPSFSSSKKSSPFLQRYHLKRSSIHIVTDVTALDSRTTLDSMDSSGTTANTPLLPALNGKSQRKLQKKGPAQVKSKRKMEAERLKQVRLAEQLDAPVVDPEVQAARDGSRKAAELLGLDHSPMPDVVPGKKSGFALYRSKSHGEELSKDEPRSKTPVGETPKTETSWTSRMRSKSVKKSASQTHLRTTDDPPIVTITEGTPPASPPIETSDSCVSALPSIAGPVLPHTSEYISAPNAMKNENPQPVSPDSTKSSSKSGMSEASASRLARAKSRDRLMAKFDRPRMATPTRAKPVAPSRTTVVEDIFPGWRAKVPDERPAQSVNRDSIPPLPQLPANAEVKAHRAGVIAAKKLKSSSLTATDGGSSALAEKPAHSTVADREMTWPEAAKAAVQDGMVSPVPRSLRALPGVSPTTTPSQDDYSSEDMVDSAIAHDPDLDQDKSTSPGHDDEHTGWEAQARAWRQRRDSAGATLGKVVPVDDEEVGVIEQASVAALSKPSSPATVVSRHPFRQNSSTRLNASPPSTDQAYLHAESYIDLIGKENRPDMLDSPRTSHPISSNASISTIDDLQGQSDLPLHPYQSTTAAAIRTSSGRVHTKSGLWQPYSPDHAIEAEHSRALSLAKLVGALANNSSRSSLVIEPLPPPSSAPTSPPKRSHDRPSRTGVPMSEAFGLDLSDVPVMLRKIR